MPFNQVLRQFTGRAVLYRRYPGFLMLSDPDSGASLWLNGAACPHEHTLTVDGQWSADGRFIVFACQDDTNTAAIYLLDMQTAATRQLAQGDAVDFRWAPTGSRLLVAKQTEAQQAFILDAASGEKTALVVAPLWENGVHPATPVGWAVSHGGWQLESSKAAMAWSPDGARIAILADQISVLDADAAHVRDGKAPILASFPGSGITPPWWSDDGRYLYLLVPYQNHNDPHSTSSGFRAVGTGVEISTGIFTSTIPIEPLWSPDRKRYLAWETTADGHSNWSLYQADGTLMHVLNSDGMMYGPFWTPDSQRLLITRLQIATTQIATTQIATIDLPDRHNPPPRSPQFTTQIATIDLAGHERVLVTTPYNVSFNRRRGAAIAPDGELFAVHERSWIAIYDFDGRLRAQFDGWAALGWRPSS
jgi:Tol biopolymer transport system component